jgi:DNA-binding transcriptional MerR regulator
MSNVASIHDAYPLRTVARLTGLSPDLIRVWEKRYEVVTPIRGPRGARLYSADDLQRLRLLARVVSTGRAIGDVAKLATCDLAALSAPVTEPVNGAPTDDRSAIVERALAAVKTLDAAALDQHLGDALVALGSLEFVRQVVSPLLIRVGDRWSDGQLSVAEEHFVSGLMRNLLSGLLRSRTTAGKPTVLLATPTGERHEFGLLIAALLIADAGIGICYLGIDLPAADISEAAHRSGAAVVGLGLANADNRPSAIDAVGQIERDLSPRCEIWLGGREAASVAGALAGSQALVVDDIDKMGREISRLRATRNHGS